MVEDAVPLRGMTWFCNNAAYSISVRCPISPSMMAGDYNRELDIPSSCRSSRGRTCRAVARHHKHRVHAGMNRRRDPVGRARRSESCVIGMTRQLALKAHAMGSCGGDQSRAFLTPAPTGPRRQPGARDAITRKTLLKRFGNPRWSQVAASRF